MFRLGEGGPHFREACRNRVDLLALAGEAEQRGCVTPRQACRHAAQIVHAPRSPELEIARATRRAALVTRAPLHGRGPASRLGRMLQGSEQRNARAVFWEQESGCGGGAQRPRSEEHTSELQSLMRISYAVFCLKKKT